MGAATSNRRCILRRIWPAITVAAAHAVPDRRRPLNTKTNSCNGVSKKHTGIFTDFVIILRIFKDDAKWRIGRRGGELEAGAGCCRLLQAKPLLPVLRPNNTSR